MNKVSEYLLEYIKAYYDGVIYKFAKSVDLPYSSVYKWVRGTKRPNAMSISKLSVAMNDYNFLELYIKDEIDNHNFLLQLEIEELKDRVDALMERPIIQQPKSMWQVMREFF